MRFIFAIFLFAAIPSIGQLKEFGWLIGTWKEEDHGSCETWKVESGILVAETYEMKNGNRKVTEEIKLLKKGSDFYYVPDIVGSQGPIEFKITSIEKNSFVAENPTHDFPKKIVYKRMDENHLQAFLYDGPTIVRFFFIKIK